MDLADIHRRQDAFYDSLVQRFESELRHTVMMAQARMAGYLQGALTVTAGQIDRSPANLRVIRSLDLRFMGFLDDAGYTSLLNAFANSFAGSKVFLQETLESLGYPPATFTASDLNLFAGLQLNSVAGMTAITEAAASAATQQALFSIGGLRFATLVELLASKISASLPRIRTIADTAMVTYYRTLTDQAFRKIEVDLPELAQRYRYSGPEDQKTRPFCERLLQADKDYSREQIAEMDNHQLGNVMITCGGYSCRHQWILLTRTAATALAA